MEMKGWLIVEAAVGEKKYMVKRERVDRREEY